MMNFNEQMNTLLYKNISLTLYSRKGWCWLCVRGELEMGTDWYILTQSSSDHSSTSSSSWLGLLNCGSLRATSPQSASWFSRWHLVPQLTPTPTGTDWPKPSLAPGYIFVSRPPASAYLHRCISWLTARSRVNMSHQYIPIYFNKSPQLSFLIRGSFKHNMGTKEIDKQTTWKHIWCCYQDLSKSTMMTGQP